MAYEIKYTHHVIRIYSSKCKKKFYNTERITLWQSKGTFKFHIYRKVIRYFSNLLSRLKKVKVRTYVNYKINGAEVLLSMKGLSL